jgi:putative membrane protein
MMRLISWMTAVSASMFAAQPAWAQQWGPNYGYGSHMWDWPGGFFLGPLMMVVVIGGFVALVVLLVRWTAGASAPHAHAHRPPLNILQERFARGEIDKAEYEERRKLLEA